MLLIGPTLVIFEQAKQESISQKKKILVENAMVPACFTTSSFIYDCTDQHEKWPPSLWAGNLFA